MKKLLSLSIAFLLLISLFAACQKAEEEKEGEASYVFKNGDVSIAIDAEAAPILESLGAWKDYAESPSCAFEGMDKVYTYAGFEIETYCLSGVDYIACVRLLDDSVKTEKGIAIGSTKDAVKDAYGEPNEASDSALTYQTSGMKLQFLLRDGVVCDIQYLKVT